MHKLKYLQCLTLISEFFLLITTLTHSALLLLGLYFRSGKYNASDTFWFVVG